MDPGLPRRLGNCYKVRLLLSMPGIDFERQEVDVAEGTDLVPEDRLDRARVMQWLSFERYGHEPYVAVVRFWVCFAADPPASAEIEARRVGGTGRG